MAATRVVIFHGTGNNPHGNWFPWLADEMKAAGADVAIPQLPTPEQQSLETWLQAFDEQCGALAKNSILVGHSIGAAFALRLLEQRALEPIRATFLVSAWEGLLGSEYFDPLIESFFRLPFDAKVIRLRAGQLQQYHGDDDPYVALARAQSLAEKLEISLQLIPGAGHINGERGYLSFPQLASDIRACLS